MACHQNLRVAACVYQCVKKNAGGGRVKGDLWLFDTDQGYLGSLTVRGLKQGYEYADSAQSAIRHIGCGKSPWIL